MWGRFLSALAAVIVLAALGAPARGFGLRTHLFIAEAGDRPSGRSERLAGE